MFWHTLPKPFFCLAPMADVTDPAFRRIIAKYSKVSGSIPYVTWTEFVSADGLFSEGREILMKDLAFTDAERPIVAQFFSRDPELMKRAGALAVELGFDGVDINMGCPDKNVCKQGCGAAMIKTPELAQKIIRATQEGTKGEIPVSVKTRIGYAKNEIETWLPALLETQPAIITLHARTKTQMSKVPADWSVIARAVEIRDEVQKDVSQEAKTLVVGNGDVRDIAHGKALAHETGCDGIMIGRGIFGNPWLFAGKVPTIEERLEVLIEHTKLFEELLPHKNFFIMKKHFKAYVSGFDGAKELRIALMETENADEVARIINTALLSHTFSSAQ